LLFQIALQTTFLNGIEWAIELSIIVFSLLLASLSISAYLKTRLKKIAFAAVAFALFTFYLLWEFLEEINLVDVVNAGIAESTVLLCILVLFFLTIVKR